MRPSEDLRAEVNSGGGKKEMGGRKLSQRRVNRRVSTMLPRLRFWRVAV